MLPMRHMLRHNCVLALALRRCAMRTRATSERGPKRVHRWCVPCISGAPRPVFAPAPQAHSVRALCCVLEPRPARPRRAGRSRAPAAKNGPASSAARCHAQNSAYLPQHLRRIRPLRRTGLRRTGRSAQRSAQLLSVIRRLRCRHSQQRCRAFSWCWL